MATTDTPAAAGRRGRAALFVLAGCGLLVVGVVLANLLGRPPQMGASEEVFDTVDALYTAVRNRDEKRVGECEVRLRGYRQEGKLPADAADALDAIVRKARAGGRSHVGMRTSRSRSSDRASWGIVMRSRRRRSPRSPS